ncbi:hypothetical protein [Geobacter sp. DSM 9736]|uniref:hypothetical protein n=1 Tax=Geobacter sp. DSM 9736 TaxID=1277350 RepID=UPI000B510420|nr:hypothetical protein [Geobacter sp. DSM 9736]SNB45343.1 hypothetical protein SAMN06269301_0751 [Geobacter sp. DSM 9736]
MKKIIMLLAASFIGTGTAMAVEHAHVGHDEKCIKECQMLVRNCGQEVDSIQSRISKLNLEISRGTAVYTIRELIILKQKLDDAEATLGHLTLGG